MKKINCPECKSPSEWSIENKHRPFCSARCQLLDLGAWASESHRIAGDPYNKIQKKNMKEWSTSF